METKKDVLTRLDSLLQQNGEPKSNPEAHPENGSASGKAGILKTSGAKSRTKKSLRFPKDDEDLQEIIGFGGDPAQFSSDDEDDLGGFLNRMNKFSNLSSSLDDDYMTVEEKNRLNLTKKNTNFNARSSNLSVDGGVRLGAEKKPAPLITVRPFVRELSPGKVNKVSPMINGEVVQKNDDNPMEDKNKSKNEKVTSFSSQVPKSSPQDTKDASPTSGRPKPATNSTETSSTSLSTQVPRSSSSQQDTKDTSPIIGKPKTSPSANRVTTEKTSPNIATVNSRSNSKLAAARLSFLNSMSSPNLPDPTVSTSSASCENEIGENKVSHALSERVDDEENNEIEEIGGKNQVKLSRKSPYVSGSGNSILKGTPKPTVVVKKPPLPKDKPKLPEKPKLFSKTKSDDASLSQRRSSLRQNKAPAPRIPSEVTISDNSNIEMNNNPENTAESYSSEADAQSEVIFEVNATRVRSEIETDKKSDEPDHQQSKSKTKEEALECIRKSLQVGETNNRVLGEETTGDNSGSSFADKRSTIANSLFNRVERSSTKRQAPRPPPNSNPNPNSTTDSVPKKDEDTEQTVTTDNESRTINSNPEIRPAINGSDISKDSNVVATNSSSSTATPTAKKNVQFSPDTKKDEGVVKKLPEPISYNKWISRGGLKNGGVVESSFTGQPIQVLQGPVKPKAVPEPIKKTSSPSSDYVAPSGSTRIVDDEVRKWTEKKRSKSVQPRGSEIDEIMGSSKAKPKARFFGAISALGENGNNGPAIRRQSRVEMYEQDRKKSLSSSNKSNRFSFSKIFNKLTNSNSALSTETISGQHSFMDEEHGREIVEREKSRLRPNIIHPIDLHSGGVEVVQIRPKNAQGVSNNGGHVFEKHRTASVFKGSSNTTGATKSILKAKVEYVDSKDSGHETSSIHTENSDSSSSSDGNNSRSSSSMDEQVSRYIINKLYCILCYFTTKT